MRGRDRERRKSKGDTEFSVPTADLAAGNWPRVTGRRVGRAKQRRWAERV